MSAMAILQQLALPEDGSDQRNASGGMISGHPLNMIFFFRSVQ
jgi:hypothetical protein